VNGTTRRLVLLRGVNLGGATTLRMAPLREALTRAGFADVRSYLQTGNVVLESPHASDGSLARAVAVVIEDACGVAFDVLVRSPSEVAQVLARLPFGPEAAPRHVLVHFLPESLGPGAAAELTAWDGPEPVVGGTILRWCRPRSGPAS
jgi:uncharacterized protein (DUF1697 family)